MDIYHPPERSHLYQDFSLPAEYVTGTNVPGVGVTYSFKAYEGFKICAFHCTAVADANVANRYPLIFLTNEFGKFLFVHGSAVPFAASGSCIINLGPRLFCAVPTPYYCEMCLPDIWLPGGSSILISLQNIQVGDSFTNPILLIQPCQLS